MIDIAVYGAGGFGREIKELLSDINKIKPIYEFVGFFDDGIEKDRLISGYPVLGGIDELNSVEKPLCVALGIGDPSTKAKTISRIQNDNIKFPVLVHPNVIIGSEKVTIGRGSIICANCVITCNVTIGDFVTLNLMCSVGHDSRLANYSSCMPAVNISGEVSINERVFVGTGAKIINQIDIGEATIVGAGAVVSKSLPKNCTAVGIPAVPIKFHAESE